jgi:hypothetical protein
MVTTRAQTLMYGHLKPTEQTSTQMDMHKAKQPHKVIVQIHLEDFNQNFKSKHQNYENFKTI